MSNKLTLVASHANAQKTRVIQAAAKTKDVVIENKQEIATLVGTTSVAYLGGRILGFKAGYAFAKNNS